MSESTNLSRHAAMQVCAGATAGFVEVCIMHPLDLVKTRFQVQTVAVNSGDPLFYNGTVDCLRKMYRAEGFFAFWKGVLPPILVETPKGAVKFLTFEQSKKVFMFGSAEPTALTFSLAGLAAGITEGVMVNPFEVVKVSQQVNRAKLQNVPSIWAITRDIVKTQGLGLQGLNKGITATIARNGVWNMYYFGFYHSVKNHFTEFKDPVMELLRKFSIGFVAGVTASFINIPFDVAKSRIQGPQPVHGKVKYFGTIRTIGIVFREEGWQALYKGIVPKILRFGPGGAILLLVYDYAFEYLKSQFPD